MERTTCAGRRPLKGEDHSRRGPLRPFGPPPPEGGGHRRSHLKSSGWRDAVATCAGRRPLQGEVPAKRGGGGPRAPHQASKQRRPRVLPLHGGCPKILHQTSEGSETKPPSGSPRSPRGWGIVVVAKGYEQLPSRTRVPLQGQQAPEHEAHPRQQLRSRPAKQAEGAPTIPPSPEFSLAAAPPLCADYARAAGVPPAPAAGFPSRIARPPHSSGGGRDHPALPPPLRAVPRFSRIPRVPAPCPRHPPGTREAP